MRIKLVGYGRTKSVDYQSEKIYIEAETESWEDPEQTILALKQQVAQLLGENSRIKSLKAEQRGLNGAISTLKHQLNWGVQAFERLRSKFDQGIAILEANGVDTSGHQFPEFAKDDFLEEFKLKSKNEEKKNDDEF